MACRKLQLCPKFAGLSRNPTASFQFLLMSDPSCSLTGRLYDGADEASFQAKASADRLTGIRRRWSVFDNGKRSDARWLGLGLLLRE